MEKKAFIEGMEKLSEIFPDREFNVEIYWDLLKDLDGKKFLIAVKDICSTTRELYPGTNLIAIIREIALSGVHLLSGEAWKEVMRQVSSVGSYGSPTFKDKLTEKAVGCIGWRTICMSETIAVERAHFIKIYEQLLNREKSEEIKLDECKKIEQGGIEKLKTLTKGIG